MDYFQQPEHKMASFFFNKSTKNSIKLFPTSSSLLFHLLCEQKRLVVFSVEQFFSSSFEKITYKKSQLSLTFPFMTFLLIKTLVFQHFFHSVIQGKYHEKK